MKSVTSKNETLAYWFLADIALTSGFEKRIL